MEQNSQSCNNTLYNQIEEAYAKVIYSYTTQIIHAARVHKRNQCLKWLQIILSAITTGGCVSALVSNAQWATWVGAIFSTLLLVLSAYFKDLDLSAVYKRHLDTSNKLWVMREKYLALLVDFETIETKIIVDRRDQLLEETAKIYDEAPVTDQKSFQMAQESLKQKESQYFTREELDQLLPIALRKGKQ